MESRIVSTKFKYISENILKIILALLPNQNLLRYIHYLDEENKHPLDPTLPNVSAGIIKNNNFIFTHFNEEILTEAKVLIFFNSRHGRFSHKNALSEDIFQMDIIVPYDFWMIETDGTLELRAYSIAYEIAKVLEEKSDIAGIGKLSIIDYDSAKVSDRHSRLTLFMKASNFTFTGGKK